METDRALSDEELNAIERRVAAASPGPWTAFLESRQAAGGDSFIRLDADPEQDDEFYLHRFVDGRPILGIDPRTDADLDFIAAARQDVPRLLAEVRRLRGAVSRQAAEPA
ncbi:hypothetical protein [Kitasatospora sp. NPDC004531]